MTHGVFLKINPLMSGSNKRSYVLIQSCKAKGCRPVYVRMTFCYHKALTLIYNHFHDILRLFDVAQ